MPDTAPAQPAALRSIPLGSTACTVCDEVVQVWTTKARVGQRTPIRNHGPRGARCPGGGIPGKTWVDAVGLPSWDHMSDLDRGCALLFLWKCHWENSYAYARENYPCRYRGEAALVALSEHDACRHASGVAGSYNAIVERLGVEEFDRLYNLALAADR